MADFSKDNCKLKKVTSTRDGEETVNAFLELSDRDELIRLLARTEDGQDMSFEDILAHCKANPDWRAQVGLFKATDANTGTTWTYARITNSKVEEVDV